MLDDHVSAKSKPKHGTGAFTCLVGYLKHFSLLPLREGFHPPPPSISLQFGLVNSYPLLTSPLPHNKYKLSKVWPTHAPSEMHKANLHFCLRSFTGQPNTFGRKCSLASLSYIQLEDAHDWLVSLWLTGETPSLTPRDNSQIFPRKAYNTTFYWPVNMLIIFFLPSLWLLQDFFL